MITTLKFNSHDDFLNLNHIYYHDGSIDYMRISNSRHLKITYTYGLDDRIEGIKDPTYFSCILDIVFDNIVFDENIDSIGQFNTFAKDWFVEVWDMDYEKDKKIIKFFMSFFENYTDLYHNKIYAVFTLRPIQVSWTQTPIDNPYS